MGTVQRKDLIKLEESVHKEIDKALPCGLILNELVSNSLKYAFPEAQQGEVRIRLKRNRDQRITLKVAGNSIGLPEKSDFQDTNSLGLKLVDALVNQLNGTIRLDNNRGTEFEITFATP